MQQQKPQFDERHSKLLDLRKQATLQWFHDPSQINGENLNWSRSKQRELSTWLMSHHQTATARHSHNIKIANRLFFENVKFKYLGTTLTNQSLIHEEIMRSLNSGTACYRSVFLSAV
jgi:hypothetical protein